MLWPILRLIFSLLILRFVFTLETLFFLWDRLTWRKILEFRILLAWSGRFVMSVLSISRETHRWAWPVGSSASLWCMWSTCTWNRWSRLSSMTVDEAMRLVLFVHLFFEVIQIQTEMCASCLPGWSPNICRCKWAFISWNQSRSAWVHVLWSLSVCDLILHRRGTT